MKRTLMLVALAALGFMAVGDGHVHAARCTPSGKGKCTACKNCRYCKHCATNGGTCSVCR